MAFVATEQQCNGCEEIKPLEEFGWYADASDARRLRRRCKQCRCADERKRRLEEHPPRYCSVCGGPLHGTAKLDVCRRTPECLRLSIARHSFLKTRRSKTYTPCAGCGSDWVRGGGGEKLCPDCRRTQFWCSGSGQGTGHVAPLAVHVGPGVCRVCRLIRFALHRAKARALPFALTADYVESIWNDTCPYLGIPLVHGAGKLTYASPTLDRIIPSAGYVEGNVEVISHRANTMKGEAGPDDLVAFARVVLQRYAPAAKGGDRP